MTPAPIVALLAAVTQPPAALDPEGLYCGVGRPVMVTVGAPQGVQTVALALLQAQGGLVAAPRNVRPGRVDLAEVLPEIREIRRTCYVQQLADGRPAGSALVVQPLLQRRPPQTEQALRPDGTPYTRITGWGPPRADGTGKPAQVFSGWRIYAERDVLLQTTKGDIVLAMRPDEAPNTAWNFLHLVGEGFYDGVIFHRVVPLTRGGQPFVIQTGDPSGGGEGGPGYWLPLEPSGLLHDFGVISMARSDHPDSAGSQFFICLSREGTARLDGQYCAFGYAVNGAETIRAIADVELADVTRGRPVDPPLVLRAELVPSPPRAPGRGRPDQRVSEKLPQVEPQPDRVPR